MTRKKQETLSLFGATTSEPSRPTTREITEVPEKERSEGPPKLRVVPSPDVPESEVVIEPTEDGRFVVSLFREHGTTVASVKYTRGQLGMLLRRIPAALEVGA